jgi:hypothetical protein
MTRPGLRSLARSILLGIVFGLSGFGSNTSWADQIEMVNGDHYAGRVLSLGADTLVLQSEVLGTLKLPRSKISAITLATASSIPITNSARLKPILQSSNALAKVSIAARTNASPELGSAMRELAGNSNMIQQVQQQLLGGAGPEAQTKFNDLLGGLLNGKMNLDDLRAEAKSTMAQARSARKELGEENGSMLDSYLAILGNFLKETEPEIALTNAPVKSLQPAAPKPLDGE